MGGEESFLILRERSFNGERRQSERGGKVWETVRVEHCSSKGKSKRDELRGLNNLLKDQRFCVC